MKKEVLLSLVLISLHYFVEGELIEPKCGVTSKGKGGVNLSVRSEKNETGGWVTTFSAWKETKNASKVLNARINQKILECDDKEIVLVQGVVYIDPFDSGNLTFHRNCGTNAAISDNGRTVQKILPDEGIKGVVLTNRPLRNNELFEVRLDEKNTKFTASLGIGITIYPPDNFSIPDHMWHLKEGNWMYYHNDIHKDGSTLIENYGRNLNELVVGDRIGVMKNKYGALHFFVNGEDQGPASSNIPSPVYGVFELFKNAMKGTIV